MALCFALGSSCFVGGPFAGYAQLVEGASADALTLFVGSILFTLGGLQTLLAWPERRFRNGGRAAWWPSD